MKDGCGNSEWLQGKSGAEKLLKLNENVQQLLPAAIVVDGKRFELPGNIRQRRRSIEYSERSWLYCRHRC